MPWKDAETKKLYDREYAAKNCKRYAVKVQNSSGIPKALEEVCKEKSTSANAYIAQALKEKLIQDGYNPDHYKPDPE